MAARAEAGAAVAQRRQRQRRVRCEWKKTGEQTLHRRAAARRGEATHQVGGTELHQQPRRRHRLGREVPAAVVGVEGDGERLRGEAGAAQPHERRAEPIARALGRLSPQH